MISIIVPIYNEAKTLVALHEKLCQTLSKQSDNFEILFINDGSQDKTEEVASRLQPLRLISLQRNYGQTAAIDVGIHNAKGDIIVLIDADLQNDPRDILKLLAKLDDGYDVAVGWRTERHDYWTRVLFSKLANLIARWLLNLPLHDFGCGLKVYRSKFIKDFRLWGEAQVFLPAVAKERGARLVEVPIPHFVRETGVAKVRISKMIRGIFDLLGIVFFVKYFARPLRFFGGVGLYMAVLSVVTFSAAVYLRIAGILNFTETPLPVIGSLFAILAVLLVMLGLMAETMLRLHYSITNLSPYMIRSASEK
ncbi:MAG: hypothetical protein A2589_02270 [Candidatus Vogelbacteria bacterium RIFOXYD1_FULL_46_19]|uniref:Glycosyltransferase 2-like domain-containing protein n=1 Tax=Candidatus Vogelbacteria bacterium RIFOXYD1_FULL_46_19 TaxID=1802439 RepID=A0A1G2QGB3_9BACT|nr:MAG: hypothetical protein A2589_02270 [Candidatus Vogelbacteria bacterium RIFOXYD1_FULL_46_19]